ncbi:MAG: LytTR family DNA-binding domain-containing protein [Eubacteriales bacterium]|jgi:DNA-binding LytR/AlgR family response regulator
MKIEIKIDETAKEPRLVIFTDRITDEVERITRLIGEIGEEPADGETGPPGESAPGFIAGFSEDRAVLLPTADIIRVYSSGGKVYAQTRGGEFTLRLRLYELESRLCGSGEGFVRISNSEIINLNQAESFDLSLAGTIMVMLKNGDAAYVSRRYVSKIKRVLGI